MIIHAGRRENGQYQQEGGGHKVSIHAWRRENRQYQQGEVLTR